MALAATVATAAAVGSGIALGSACSVPGALRPAEDRSRERERDEGEAGQRQAPYAPPRRAAGNRRAPAPPPREEWDPMDDVPADGWEGFSMEEARAFADESQSKALARTPAEVLQELQRGNARFWMNSAQRPEKSAFQRRALISKQFPSVAILGCSDSRVPTEIVFDQGLGDIFVIRVAGNCLDTTTLASLQYAVHHLKVKVLVVMGHEMCGAVKAAMQADDKLEAEPEALERVLKEIKTGLTDTALHRVHDARARDREAVTSNVRKQVERLTRDKGIYGKVKSQDLIVVGAFYELSSGIVDFFFEVSEVDVEKSRRATDAPGVQNLNVETQFERQPSRGVQSRFTPKAVDGGNGALSASLLSEAVDKLRP